MSVQVATYVLYGVILDYKLAQESIEGEDEDVDFYDRCESYMDNSFNVDSINPKGNVTLLFDGMGGKYIAVGHVIARTEDWQHFYKPISLDGHQDHLAEWETQTKAALCDLGLETAAGDVACGWHVISHYG